MGRPKGSKNKSKEAVKPATVVAEPAPLDAYVPLTPITAKAKQAMITKAKAQCEESMALYGMKKFPDEIMQPYFYRILNAPDKELALKAQERAVDRFQIHLWSQWAEGKIVGRVTEQNVERRAKQAESLAKYLESLGQYAAAETQIKRAEEIRNKVK